ncbi:hypothetical protein DFH06DRAFT_48289 [Mycena polygramma]|nr:hypothetical protein DFH06DRAFT_48289 [Mycena polygramma]
MVPWTRSTWPRQLVGVLSPPLNSCCSNFTPYQEGLPKRQPISSIGPTNTIMSWMLAPELGPLSNREAEYEYQAQNILVVGNEGRLQAAPFIRHGPKVPTEILAEIFIHCLPDGRRPFTTPDLADAPLILCGICRRWREVAISTPRLWSALHIDFDLMHKRGAYETDFYQMWLSRAGATPLSLYLQNEDDSLSGVVDSPLKTIVGMSRQWREIEVDMGSTVASFIPPVETGYPLLEKLNIFVLDDFPISFCEAPKLRDVSICQYSPQVQLPWHQLTKLDYNEVPISLCLEILRDSPSLLDCTFRVEGDPSALPVSMLEHSRLQRLELGGTINDPDPGPTGNYLPILNCMKIPGLQSLTLKFPERSRRIPLMDISPYLAFMFRSSCQLHALDLVSLPTTSDGLIECLKATPSLVHLELTLRSTHPPVDADAIFAPFSEPGDCLPKLESFRVYFPYEYDMLRMPTVSVVVQMLCSRWAAVGKTRLQSFRLGHHRAALEFDMAITSHSECHRLQAEGMDLYWHYRPSLS